MRNPIEYFKDKKTEKQEQTATQGMLDKWRTRFDQSYSFYGSVLDRMDANQRLYDGDRDIPVNPNLQQPVKLVAPTVHNVSYEMIESQVDSNIPLPAVTSQVEADEQNAIIAEEMIKAQLNRLPMEAFNDMDERVCPVHGGSWYLVEWDNEIRTHDTVGDISISFLHPRQVIPQAGVTDWRQGEYIYLS